jgi:hypothetical protein
MAENKTRATDASVDDYLAAIENESRRGDCHALVKLMTRITQQPPRMWGSSIVGFGHYHYRYDSGREGDMFRTGFSSRKNDLVVYLVAHGAGHDALLARLGRHKMGKSCLYIRRLDEIDADVLEQLVDASVAELRRRYG